MQHKMTCILLMVLMLGLSTLAEDQQESCEVSPHQRINCGYPGVTAEECQNKGCCFVDNPPGYPWCFQPQIVKNPEGGTEDDECLF